MIFLTLIIGRIEIFTKLQYLIHAVYSKNVSLDSLTFRQIHYPGIQGWIFDVLFKTNKFIFISTILRRHTITPDRPFIFYTRSYCT